MRLKIIISVILFFVTQQYLHAQKNIYQFSNLDITNGLSNNQINCIYKDANGFMWFGTTSGLNRYDGYNFKIFKHEAGGVNSLIENNVVHINEGPDNNMWIYTHSGISIYNSNTEAFSNDIAHELLRYNVLTNQLASIKKDKEGNFWFLTNNQGVYCYHPANKTTDSYSTSGTAFNTKAILHSNDVTDIVDGQNNTKWFIYNDGVIDELDMRTNSILLRTFSLYKANNSKPENYSAMLGSDHNLWIYSTGSFMGVYCFNTLTNMLMHFGKDTPTISLNSNVINTIVQANDNNIWIGTDHGGINIIDAQTHKVSYLLNSDDDIKSLRGNSVILYKDNAGIIWAGTFKQGISYFHNGIIQFSIIRHYSSNIASLPYDDVDCFVEDINGNLWIGTNGGGLIFYNKTTKKYTQFKHDPSNPKSLSNDVVISLCIDHENKLWVGTYFGGIDRLEGNNFVNYRHKDNIKGSISDDRVYSIIEDSSLKLWVGTFAGGLNIYDRKTDSFIHPHYPMSSDYTAIIYEDKQKNIWIGRDKGIDVIEKNTGSVKHYYNQPKNPNSLVANDVNRIIQDKKGLFWIGTKEGLSILNSKTEKFINIDEEKGLPNSNISNILEDKNGLIWISTANGIASIRLIKAGNTYKYQIHKYDEFDGLQGREYNLNAALKTKNGDMIFGGAHGFNIFNPESIHTFIQKPKLIFTDFQLFNKSVKVGDASEGRVLLTKSITETNSVVLNHNQNVFSIEFAACDYFNPGKITYQYKLEGFDQGWLISQKDSRKATYTNLDANDYIFKVRASNTNDPGNVTETTLNIKILPPFWKSSVAYALYMVMVISLLFYIRHRGILQIKRQFELKQDKIEAERKVAKEREEARRMHELDLIKIKFFTNVSHEFRTPLSLIISPIDNLIKNNEKPEQEQQLLLIKRNGRRLLNLVNQLLDFRKMEFKELKLNLAKSDIIQFIRDVCSSFTDMANQNHIGYLFDSEVDTLITKFDHDKIERVLFNLLSNSFKFTSAGEHISVFISLSRDEDVLDDQQILEIKIMDTGIGISKEKQEKIFERFFQDNLPEGLLNQGSGIGLSITREFIKMHNGDINVESEPGDGSCFTIRLPIGIECDKVVSVPDQNKQVNNLSKNGEHVLDSGKKPVVLLIEDNDDLRFYLKDNLKHSFHIIEAVNGKDGWQKTLALHPHLIVSDVSMPEMNGLDLCKKIRQDNRTAHIPIILLTALIREEDQLAGTANGANDYITKPFNFEILLSKINGLLLMQQTLKKTYQKQVDIQAENISIVSEDEKFLKNTLSCIEKNITNPNFSVEELSRQMSLSRVSLYKRLLALTGKSPVDCIRTIRLKRAVQLLEKSRLSIANVAYEVGFNNPTYFSKVFKEEYGTLPSEYVNELRKKEKESLQTLSF
jgi:signal transduction histidine kinase/ligand-binding sensor domain-containing protein/DNA-binding response OmpR family regulator